MISNGFPFSFNAFRCPFYLIRVKVDINGCFVYACRNQRYPNPNDDNTVNSSASPTGYRPWIMVVIVVIAGRLLLSASIPLMEFSEARYAEIARTILDTGDWITLWFYPEQPFWGKPPLAFWSIASSFLVFGVNEFAARLTPFLFTLGTALVLGYWTRQILGTAHAVLATIVFGTCWLVLQVSGAVLTDPLLLFTTTLVMAGFWQACEHGSRTGAWLTWAALGAGLLAKGPIALVLCGLACGSWVILYRQWQVLWRNMHLVSGLLLMSLIAVPWYYLAEQKTPGFLDYFIVGEHFERYTQSKWTGDTYGAVKDRPPGTILLYFLVATIPWGPLALATWPRPKMRAFLGATWHTNTRLYGYLALWVAAPLIFFVPAKNVLVTYALPAIPAFAVLMAVSIPAIISNRKPVVHLALFSTLAFFVIYYALYLVYFRDHRYNQKPMVEKYLEMNEKDPGDLVYTGSHIFSPRFYTKGRVHFENDREKYTNTDRTFYIAVRKRWLPIYERRFGQRCRSVMKRIDFSLLYCPSVRP